VEVDKLLLPLFDVSKFVHCPYPFAIHSTERRGLGLAYELATTLAAAAAIAQL